MTALTSGFQPLPEPEPMSELLDEAMALVSRVNERLRSSTDRFTSASRPHGDDASRVANGRVESETID